VHDPRLLLWSQLFQDPYCLSFSHQPFFLHTFMSATSLPASEPCLNLSLAIVVNSMHFVVDYSGFKSQLCYFLYVCFMPKITLLHYHGGCMNQIRQDVWRACGCAVDLHSAIPLPLFFLSPFLLTCQNRVYSPNVVVAPSSTSLLVSYQRFHQWV
jgi:hypothetical protein